MTPTGYQTRFLATESATDHYLDISAARTLLGFTPKERSLVDV